MEKEKTYTSLVEVPLLYIDDSSINVASLNIKGLENDYVTRPGIIDLRLVTKAISLELDIGGILVTHQGIPIGVGMSLHEFKVMYKNILGVDIKSYINKETA